MMNERNDRQQNRLQENKASRNAAAFGEEHSQEPLYGLNSIEGGPQELVEESSAETPTSPDFGETRAETVSGSGTGGGRVPPGIMVGSHEGSHEGGGFNVMWVALFILAGSITTLGAVLFFAHGGTDHILDILSRYPANR